MNRYYEQGSIYWVKTLDLNNSIINETDERVTQLALKETSLKVYSPGTVLVAMYGGFNQIGRTGLLQVRSTVNQAITAIIECKNKLSPLFLIFYLNYQVKYWVKVASSSRKDPNISSKDVRAFPIPCPTKAEQEAIATVLSDMDDEIQTLEAKLNKTRQIKQGMMAELLTGRTRLL